MPVTGVGLPACCVTTDLFADLCSVTIYVQAAGTMSSLIPSEAGRAFC